MKKRRDNQPSVRIPLKRPAGISAPAAIGAVLFLILFGISFRMVFNYLERPSGQVAFVRGSLNAFPDQLGPWVGVDEPLTEAVFKAADVDDYVQRVYTHQTTRERVSFYVAAGARARDLLPHRPEVCYPSAGWTLRSTETVSVTLPDESQLDARLIDFAPNKLTTNNLLVLNFYIVDDQAWPDVSALRYRAATGQSAIEYMVQVQIVFPYDPVLAPERPVELPLTFAALTIGPLRETVASALAQSRETSNNNESDVDG